MSFEPRQKNKVPEVAILCLFLAAGVAFAFSSFEWMVGRGFLQLFALTFFCAMAFVLVRYKMTTFRYSVRLSAPKERSLHHEDDDGELCVDGISYEDATGMPVKSLPPKMLELVVERRQGKGAFYTECILKLSEIESCTLLPEEAEAFKALSAQNKRLTKYKYFRNMVAPNQAAIVSGSPSGRVIVYIEAEKELCEYLKAVAAYNKNGSV